VQPFKEQSAIAGPRRRRRLSNQVANVVRITSMTRQLRSALSSIDDREGLNLKNAVEAG
jgi:hypothetical protein